MNYTVLNTHAIAMAVRKNPMSDILVVTSVLAEYAANSVATALTGTRHYVQDPDLALTLGALARDALKVSVDDIADYFAKSLLFYADPAGVDAVLIAYAHHIVDRTGGRLDLRQARVDLAEALLSAPQRRILLRVATETVESYPCQFELDCAYRPRQSSTGDQGPTAVQVMVAFMGAKP